MHRSWLLIMAAMISTTAFAGTSVPVTGRVSKTHKTPTWMSDGIVIAGDWAPMMQRKQEINVPWTQTGYKLSDAEAEEAIAKEMSPETADELKRRGVTFVMMPIFSGLGTYEQEHTYMERTKRFAALVHERGMRVGVYVHQGQISREFQVAMPESREWLAWPSPEGNFKGLPPSLTREEGQPVYRNHPGYQAFMRGVIEYAIKDAKADFLHFDNYVYPSGWSPTTQADFKRFLRMKYKPSELKRLFGDEELSTVVTDAYAKKSPAVQEWQLFQAWSLAESFRQLAEYARTLNPQVATEINASGVTFHGYRRPIDLTLSLPNGDAFWDEQAALGWDAKNRKLNSSIRSYKLARMFNQKCFTYTSIRLARAEALAFNNDTLGCLYWFLYGRINWPVTTTDTADTAELPETKFYLANRDLYNNGEMIADVAVFRGRDESINGPQEAVLNTSLFEQALIAGHIPFTWITDQHLDHLTGYRAVVLADNRMMCDEHIKKLLKYVRNGGNLIVTDKTASLDPWGNPRGDWEQLFPAGNMGEGKIVRTEIEAPVKIEEGTLPLNTAQLAESVTSVMGAPTVVVNAPECVAAEFVQQKNRLIVHLVDYSQSSSGEPITIKLDPSLGKITGAKALSPTRPPETLKVEAGTVTVPWPDVYAAVVINTD